MKNILVVEDDIGLSNGIVLALKGNGLSFQTANTLKDAKILCNSFNFDLILLDVNLPDGNGFDFLKYIKSKINVCVIMLTANDLETDVVSGFELGADDYITKPFSLMVLRARVTARLRDTSTSNIIQIGDFTFNFEQMDYRKGRENIMLSKTEQRLLHLLIENRGKVLSRDILVDKIWTDGAEYVDENALSVTVKRLRDKLENNPSKPLMIKTVYGIGYTWCSDGDSNDDEK